MEGVTTGSIAREAETAAINAGAAGMITGAITGFYGCVVVKDGGGITNAG